MNIFRMIVAASWFVCGIALAASGNPICPPGLAPFQLTAPPITSTTVVDDAGNSWTFQPNQNTAVAGTLTCTPPGAALPTGTYNFVDSAANLALDDGWVPVGLYTNANLSGQRLIWDGTKLKCDPNAGCGAALYLKKSNLTAVMDATGGTFVITSVPGGYTIKDTASGLYLASLGVSGAAQVKFQTAAFTWTTAKR